MLVSEIFIYNRPVIGNSNLHPRGEEFQKYQARWPDIFGILSLTGVGFEFPIFGLLHIIISVLVWYHSNQFLHATFLYVYYVMFFLKKIQL